MSEDELRKQVNRERTRMIKLRYNDENEALEAYRVPYKSTFSWVPLAIVAILGLLTGRIMTSAKSIPSNALVPTELHKTVDPTAAPEVSSLIEPQEHVTDEQVKRMLSHVNGGSQNPPMVAPGVSGQMINYGSATETPEMVKVRGQWFKKHEDNIYNVKGETIYYESKKRQ
jgi:hypothetical protein